MLNVKESMMNKRTTTSVTIDISMIDQIESHMKANGITFCELVRRALSLYLTNGEQADSKDSEQLEHTPETKSLSDMLNDSDYS